MKWSKRLSPVRFADRPDWRQPHIRDTIILLAFATFVYVLAHFNDLPEKLFDFSLEHADWEFDDMIFVVFIMAVPMIIYGVRRYREVSHEVKARISAEQEARNLARHDPLTGLANRRFFGEQLDEYLRGVSATRQLAVLMLDLDGFKTVNDMHGHAAGDKALSEFARRVAAASSCEFAFSPGSAATSSRS